MVVGLRHIEPCIPCENLTVFFWTSWYIFLSNIIIDIISIENLNMLIDCFYYVFRFYINKYIKLCKVTHINITHSLNWNNDFPRKTSFMTIKSTIVEIIDNNVSIFAYQTNCDCSDLTPLFG